MLHVSCPFFGDFGLARHARGLVTALARICDVALTSWNEPEPGTPLEPAVQALLARGRADARPKLALGIGDMPSMRQLVGEVRIGCTVWETTRVPPASLAALRGLGEVWIPSAWGRDVLVENGLAAERVHVVPGGVDPTWFTPAPAPAPRPRFRFLCVGKWEERKGLADLVRVFARTFRAEEPVELYLHAWHACMPELDVGARVRALLGGAHPSIIVGPRQDDAGMLELYRSSDAFVLPTRAEAWGLPVIEAMACGLPVIVTDHGGQRAFASDDVAYPIRVRELVEVHDPVEFPRHRGPFGRWAQPDLEHLGAQLRRVYERAEEARRLGEAARARVSSRWTWDRAAVVALARLERHMPWPAVMQAYLAAHQIDPANPLPLFRLGVRHLERGEPQLAHLYLAAAMRTRSPGDADDDVQLPLEYAVACHHVGRFDDAIATAGALLRSPRLPPVLVEHVIANRRFSLVARRPPGGPGAPVARVHVAVVVDAPAAAGVHLDELIESLTRQRGVAFEACFFGDVAAERLPESDPRFVRAQGAPDAWLAARAAGDAVVWLSPCARLAADDALARLAGALAADAGTTAVHAQHRRDDGALGDAMPDDPVAHAPLRALRAHAAVEASGTAFLDDVLTVVPGAPAAIAAPAPAGDGPLISCLLVTHDRLALARRAIRSFAAQTYPRRELVIVSAGDARYRRALAATVDELAVPDVRLVHDASESPTLGALRNRSLDAARGEVVCPWDDDDVSHPERLARQLGFLLARRARACALVDHLQLFEDERRVYWVDWSDGDRVHGRERLLPGTLLAFRDERLRYPERGPAAERGEDSALLASLETRAPIAALHGQGHLYLYCFHGRNTYPLEHHRRLTRYALPRAALSAREATLRTALAAYPIPRPALVVGADGPVFAI